MAVNFAPNGLVNASVGCHRTIAPGEVWWRRSGRIWWVNGAASNAADDSSHGQDPLKPLATLYYAVTTAASAGDAIVVAQTHGSEATTNTMHITQASLAIFGCGSMNAQVQLRNTNNHGPIFSVEADGFELHNFLLLDSSNDGTGTYAIGLAGGNGTLIGECTFQQGNAPSSTGWAQAVLASSGSHVRLENCVFTSVQANARPQAQNVTWALNVANMIGVHVVDCTFNGKAGIGYDTGAINAQGCTELEIYTCDFKYNANIVCNSSTKGILSQNTFDPESAVQGVAFKWYESGAVSLAEGGVFPVSGPDFAVTGKVYWVNNQSPNASDSNAGTDRDLPLATLGQALSLATTANGDLIIVLSGHTESPSGPSGASAPVYSVSKNSIKIVGTGNGGNRPSFGFSANASGNWPTLLFSVTGRGFEIINLQFLVPGGSVSGVLQSIGAQTEIGMCYFPIGVNQTGSSILINSTAAGGRIYSNSFLVTAPQPPVSAANHLTLNTTVGGANYFAIQDNIFDNGSFTQGQTNGLVVSGAGASILGNTFRAGAQANITNTYSWMSGTISDGSSYVSWSG